jgi:uncharacterized protein YjbI with pentapeptide repeats
MSPSNTSILRTGQFLWFLCLIVGNPGSVTSETLEISLASGNEIKLTWNVPPLAPFLESSVEMGYTLQATKDFQRWETIDTLTVSDPTLESTKTHLLGNEASGMFFRCETTLSKDNLSLGAADLSNSRFHNVNLSGQDLAFSLVHEANFTQSDLRGADLFATFGNRVRFRNAKLTGANLSASILRGSDFDHADLAGATARFAQMSGNSFRGADLRFVDFTGTDLFNSDMTDADLRGAILLETDLTFVRLHGARIDALNRIPPTPLLAWQIVNEGRPGANLSKVDLTGMILTGSNLRGTNLRNANLTAVDLSGADLSGADLRGSQVPLVGLRGTILSNESRLPAPLRTVWEIVNLQQDGRQLDNVNLSEAILTGGHMQGFSLVGANLSQAFMIGTNLQHADLREANLTDAFLQGADLRFANLRDARMTRTQLTDAKFENTIMPNGTIRNSE